MYRSSRAEPRFEAVNVLDPIVIDVPQIQRSGCEHIICHADRICPRDRVRSLERCISPREDLFAAALGRGDQLWLMSRSRV
jgi:hypothetical protein